MEGLSYVPDFVKSPIKAQLELINVPRIGCDANWTFPTMQLNLAPAVEWQDRM